MSKGNRRADGSLRPSVLRYRARKRGITFLEPAAVARFRSLTYGPTRIWNSYARREDLALDIVQVGALLEEIATEQRWCKCRDTDGVVRAIGLPRNHRDRRALPLEEHRPVMLARLARAAALEVAA